MKLTDSESAYVRLINGKGDEYHEIVCAYDDRVVIQIDWTTDLPDGCRIIADVDHHGIGLAMVPASRIHSVVSDDDWASMSKLHAVERCARLDAF